MFARTALRRAAGEDGGEAPHDLVLFGLGDAALLVAHPQLVERPAGAVEPLAELFGGQVALGGAVVQAAELGGLHLELAAQGGRPVLGRAAAGERDAREQPEHAERQRDRDHVAVHGTSSGEGNMGRR